MVIPEPKLAPASVDTLPNIDVSIEARSLFIALVPLVIVTVCNAFNLSLSPYVVEPSLLEFPNAAPISLNALPKSLASEEDSPAIYRS